MDNIEDLLRGLEEQEESEDRTVFVRSTPAGDKISFEIREKTSFNGYPSTTKHLHSSFIDCGHLVTQENPVAGFCAGRRWFRRCNREYCIRFCAVQCGRCGISVSARCCARSFRGYLLCKRCARLLKCMAFGAALGGLMIRPFLTEETFDERQARLSRERDAELMEQRRGQRELEWEQRRQQREREPYRDRKGAQAE